MNIALDYDGTFTEDPGIWTVFIVSAVKRGHKVYLVTMRYPQEGDDVFRQLGDVLSADRIIFTERKAKRRHMMMLGIPIQVWIDDMPEFVCFDAADAKAPSDRLLKFEDGEK